MMLEYIIFFCFAALTSFIYLFLLFVQVNGAMGLSQLTPLAQMYSWARALRLADGPDEVHRETVAKLELKQMKARL